MTEHSGNSHRECNHGSNTGDKIALALILIFVALIATFVETHRKELETPKAGNQNERYPE